MLQRLIDDLRRQPPLARTTADMATLLTTGASQWIPRPLIARDGTYTRTFAYGDDNFEILLLNWSPGAPTPIHDHGDQHCWMLVLAGRLQIDDYVRLDAGETPGHARVRAQGSSLLETGGLDLRSGRFSLHRVAATPDARAVTLHVYSGRLDQYLVYDEAAGRCAPAFSSLDDKI